MLPGVTLLELKEDVVGKVLAGTRLDVELRDRRLCTAEGDLRDGLSGRVSYNEAFDAQLRSPSLHLPQLISSLMRKPRFGARAKTKL